MTINDDHPLGRLSPPVGVCLFGLPLSASVPLCLLCATLCLFLPSHPNPPPSPPILLCFVLLLFLPFLAFLLPLFPAASYTICLKSSNFNSSLDVVASERVRVHVRVCPRPACLRARVKLPAVKMSRHFNARSTRTNVSDEDDTTASSLGEGFLHDDDEEEEHVNVGADGKWDESLAKLRYTMVAFELFDKSQMKRFFGTVWALIGVAAVYVMVFLSHAAVCSANATFPEAFEKYVQAECSRNGTIPGNFSAPEFWSFCCSPFDGIGHAGPGGCFDAPEVEQRDYAHPPPTYMGCCHVDLEGALDVCDSHCQFSLVDAVARTLLGTASVVGLFVYGARFCISPNMRRFEQKFVLGLFFLCVLMTNPVSAGFLLTQRYNIDVFGSCGTARYETPSASQKVSMQECVARAVWCASIVLDLPNR